MLRDGARWIISPSDLVDVFECELRSTLKYAQAAGLADAPVPAVGGPSTITGHGIAYEAQVLARFEAVFGDGVRRIGTPAPTPEAHAAAAHQTLRAMDDGAPVIYQAAFLHEGFHGRADFLVDAAFDAHTGEPVPGVAPGSYQPYDVKLARSAKPAAVLQLTAYADVLGRTGRRAPEVMHLLLGDGEQVTLRVADYLPVLDDVRRRLERRLAEPAALPARSWADRCRGCATCAFAEHCVAGREQARDLSLVAGMRSDQRRKLRQAGIDTIDALAAAGEQPASLAGRSWTGVQAQARLQVRQDSGRSNENPHGTIDFEVFDEAALRRLPEPDPGDLHFDMESDPFALRGRRLEYLFGVLTVDDEFTPIWGHDRAGEKAAFERFVDLATARLRQYPGAHIYHYASYEPDALKRLAATHATREAQVDHLLRSEALVDLYAVVRKSVRVSARSYSIKSLEPLYMPGDRGGEVTTALGSIDAYENYLELLTAGDIDAAAKQLDEIAEYNRYDCASTLGLQRWLLERRRELGPAATPATAAPDAAIDRALDTADADPGPDGAPTAAEQRMAEETELVRRLTHDLPAELDDQDDDQRARHLLGAVLGYYRREANPAWWEYYELIEAPQSDLERSQTCAVPLAVEVGDWQEPAGNQRMARRVTLLHCDPDSQHPFASGDSVRALYPPTAGSPPTVLSASVTGATPDQITLQETCDPGELPDPSSVPVAVLPGPPVNTKVKEQAVRRLAEQVAEQLPHLADGAGPDLLRRRPPRLRPGRVLPAAPPHELDPTGGGTVAAVIGAVDALDDSYLAVQGPPGAGKTYVAVQLILHLVAAGRKVAVCANSHRAVEHVLDEVHAADPGVPTAKRPKQDPVPEHPWEQPKDPKSLAAWRSAHPGGHLVGGTSWHLAHQAIAAEPFDVLIIEEAGQFALTDALAVAGSTRNLVLVGDPQQLPQVVQGTHPGGAGASALGHVIGGEDLVPAGFGYFLPTTRRLHPDLCAPISALSYRGELHAHPLTAGRRLDGVAPGLYLHAVEHHGNTTHSGEEVAEVVRLVSGLLGRSWQDGDERRPLGPDDVLVVAPYNRQTRALERALAEAGLPGVRVGTVDRFQGQEAPVVVMSMTSSSTADLPRGLDFLLSRNRLNVALSRAEAVAVLVCAPDLLHPRISSVRQMRLVSGFLGLQSAARPLLTSVITRTIDI